jgi:hypothetical protein
MDHLYVKQFASAIVLMACCLGLSTPLAPSPKALAATTAPLYSLDAKSHLITIHPIGDASTQINSAFSYLTNRADQDTLWTMKFDGGNYYLNRQIGANYLNNVTLLSDRNNPAILIKSQSFQNEYLFYTRFSKNVAIKNFDFYGLSRVYNPNNYTSDPNASVWRDQGLYFGSSNGVVVNMNRFFSFGNAAIRITTTERDPIPGVNSFNSEVTQNYFNNVFQVTTTSNDTIHGGSSNYLFQGNTFDDLRGSIKFASRTGGASNVYIRFNTIRSSNTDGIEIAGYTNMDVYKNVFQNIARNAINCYSNDRSVNGFQWGDNITFRNNIVKNTGGGFRFSADASGNGFQPVPRNVAFTDNDFSDLTGSAPAITLLNSPFPGLKITNNKFSNIPSKSYFYIQQKSSDMTISNNLANNQLLTTNY